MKVHTSHIKCLGVRISSIKFYLILSNVWSILEVIMWYIELYLTFENTFKFWEQEKSNVWKYVWILRTLCIGNNSTQEEY